ncbi:hypothetical protein ACB094_01G047100 [Castanea mollissima]
MEEESQRALVIKLAVFTFVLFQCVVAQQQEHLNSSFERSALLELRSSLGLRAKDWPIKLDPCRNWTGVQCNNSRVTEINVSGLRRSRYGILNQKFAVDSLANLTSLVSFNASGFLLPGPIPDWFGQRLNALQVLDLSSSSVTGSIPPSLGGLSSLRRLYLSGNSLTGSISSSLGNLSELLILDLSRNSLTGSLPSGFESLAKLTRLDLSSNYLSGSIPDGLGNLSSLEYLSLSDNSFTSIPGELGNLSGLVELDLSKNALSGSLPAELKRLRSLRRMDIGVNVLEGPFPDSIFMSLGSNKNATSAVFNLSNNRFYGVLNLSYVGKFSSVDFSGNYFQGKVVDAGQSNATLDRNCLQLVQNQRSADACRQFYTDRGLLFDNFGDPEQNQVVEHSSKTKKRWIYIVGGLVGGIGFIALLVLVMVLLLRMCDKGTATQRTANVGSVPEGDNTSLPKDLANLTGIGEIFTYEQMLHFTGDFSEANLIKHGHSGDLFRGLMEGGIPVVIKRVDLRSFKKESYMMELEFFSKVSHTRLVPLLGHCLEHESEKLLVYKSMPNGDLANSLHSFISEDGSSQSLDWITRLKIAIGAAEGLSYLHHECNPPLVHRDIHASSILLDDKFEVRLGSLSEVHSQGDSHQNVLTRFLRKPQISEQGPSGSSSASCAYDAYCFGKVLLELVTGKVGISKFDDATTREWLELTLPYISIYDKELVTKIVDPSLIIDEDLLEEVWAVAIVARSCLNSKPSRRPAMKHILKALENPLKVVREESSSSAKLRTTSSNRSWSAAIFGSWRHSSSESATIPSQTGTSGLKQPGRENSHGSGGQEYSSSNKRLSSEIFPEPIEMQDLERQDEH